MVAASDWARIIEIDPDGRRLVTEQQVIVIGDLLAPDADSRQRLALLSGAMAGIPECARSQIYVPLIRAGKVTGALVVVSGKPNLYKHSHIPLFRTLAASVSAALERMHFYEDAVSAAALGERSRIARELHDSVSQSLFGILLGLRTIKHTIDSGSTPSDEQVGYVNALAEAALNDTRALVFELRPEYLEREGFLAAIDKQARTLGARHQIEMRTKLPPAEPSLPLKTKEALYRITVEAIQNALKHAAATRIEVEIEVDPAQPSKPSGAGTRTPLRILVRDNGRGFDPRAVGQGHFGLLTMRERAAQIDACVSINSAPGAGAEILIELHENRPPPGATMRRVRLEPVGV
jgi:signal transduction histidine kinase